MEHEMIRKKIRIGGMTCISCQNKIERKLKNTPGVKSVSVDFARGTADITFDPEVATLKELSHVIERLNYEVLADQKLPAENK